MFKSAFTCLKVLFATNSGKKYLDGAQLHIAIVRLLCDHIYRTGLEIKFIRG